MSEEIPILKNRLSPDEVVIIQMALDSTIKDLEAGLKEPRLNDDAKKYIRDMLRVAKSAHIKIAQSSGKMVQLDPYVKGDENEFLK